MVYPKDFFYERLRQQIIDTYIDKPEGNCATEKNIYLFLLFRYYDAERFAGLKGLPLREERDKFLDELKELLNRSY